MKTKIKTWWARVVETVVRVRPVKGGEPLDQEPARGVMDEDANARALVEIADQDPKYKAVMDIAYAQVADNLQAAFDEKLPETERRAWLDRAAGVRDFIGNVETARSRLKAKREENQRREARMAEAAARAGRQTKAEKS